jgi:D-methionine transport system ATP-binding protein
MIKLDHITQTYKTPEGREFKALDDVSIEIRPGEIFGIIGRSGAGKSTLVRCINLLNRPSEGTVTVDGKNLTELSEDELRESRRSIGMIFQHFNLLSSRTVYDNVALPLELVGTPKNVIREKVEPLLKLVGLTEHAHKYPSQLSGGQKQRVGIARALTNDPKVLLSDEATSALDPETTVATLALLKRINKELGLTIVMITHEMQVVKQICERVVVMNYGKIVEQGKVVDIFMSPQHETTKALIGNVMARDMPASILDRFRKARENHPNSDAVYLLRLAFSGNEVTRPVISECSRRFNLDFNILRGTVDDVQGQTLGSLTVLIEAESSVFIEAVNFLKENGVVVEEINDVK